MFSPKPRTDPEDDFLPLGMIDVGPSKLDDELGSRRKPLLARPIGEFFRTPRPAFRVEEFDDRTEFVLELSGKASAGDVDARRFLPCLIVLLPWTPLYVLAVRSDSGSGLLAVLAGAGVSLALALLVRRPSSRMRPELAAVVKGDRLALVLRGGPERRESYRRRDLRHVRTFVERGKCDVHLFEAGGGIVYLSQFVKSAGDLPPEAARLAKAVAGALGLPSDRITA